MRAPVYNFRKVFRARTFITAAVVLAWAGAPAAHEIPNDVTVQSVAEAGRRPPPPARPRAAHRHARHGLPVAAARDSGAGRPVESRSDAARDAATLWVADEIEL